MKRYAHLLIFITVLLCVLTSCITIQSTKIPITEAEPLSTSATTQSAGQSTITTTTTTTASTTIATTTENPNSKPPITTSQEPASDPYVNITKDEFYQNYTKATSRQDALYRSQHGFMSGDIGPQDQKPTLATYQPMADGKYYRNTAALYSEDKNTYYILDAYGNPVNIIFRGGAYVSLEEVAAYVYAFGEIPANYLTKKSGSPSSSIWGEYLRLNHSKFSGDTSRYPYEPELPNISGCGGNLYYYEIDIGTTGTDCDPSYIAAPYNNGNKIVRGAARIVYSYSDLNNNRIIDPNEKFVFYTYNHYNDFQEYLNYEGGWGEIFGNITGGGKISSTSQYNPTPYVPTIRADFTKQPFVVTIVMPHYILDKHYLFV